MKDKQVIAIWASNIMQDYASKKAIQKDRVPAYAEKYGLANFLIDNYELFHLYPDEAVFDEIDREITELGNG
jgi:hypothetical protein